MVLSSDPSMKSTAPSSVTFTRTALENAGRSNDTISVLDPTPSPIVMATRREPPSDLAERHDTLVCATHAVDSHPVCPTCMACVNDGAIIGNDINTVSPPLGRLPSGLELATVAASVENANVMLPSTCPAVTTVLSELRVLVPA
jgi:hypothetical protein